MSPPPKPKPNPQAIQRLLEQGVAAHREGRRAEAMGLYKQVLDQVPNHVDAIRLVGLAQAEQGRFSLAIGALNKAISIAPKAAILHRDLSRVHALAGHPDLAASTLERALELEPANFTDLCALGSFYAGLGKNDEAVAAYDKALAIKPEDPDAIAGKCAVLERIDRYDEARLLLEPHLEKPIPDDRLVASFAVLAPHLAPELNATGRAVELLERAAERSGIPPRRRANLLYPLADLYAKRKDHDRAFATYTSANQQVKQPWDPARQWAAPVDRLLAAYTTESFKTLPRSTNTSEFPVFIVGMPRSGTSLVEQILDCHPQIHGAGELPDIRNLVIELYTAAGATSFYPSGIESFTPDTLDRAANAHLDSLRKRDPSAARITDKMPENTLSLGMIAQLFPRARVILCQRQPIDNCVSCFTQNFTFGHAYTQNLHQLAHYYIHHRRLEDHWLKTLPIPITTVRYEDMVSDQEATTRKLIDFLGLEWSDACLRHHESKRRVATASYHQIRKPVYTSSVERWRVYEKHLAPLIEPLRAAGLVDA